MEHLPNGLVVIDMQKSFCDSDSPLWVRGAMGCLPKVKEAVDIARASGIPIIWVIREHHPSGADVERFRQHLYDDTDNGPTIPGTPGVKLADGLEAQPQDHIVVKKRFSGFMHTPLDSILRRLGVDRIVLCGVQTPNCIRATAYDAVCLDYKRVTVLSDATASANSAIQEGNLYDMRNVSIDTPTTQEWAEQLVAEGAA